jgi:transcription termination/antitermination protein NusG
MTAETPDEQASHNAEPTAADAAETNGHAGEPGAEATSPEAHAAEPEPAVEIHHDDEAAAAEEASDAEALAAAQSPAVPDSKNWYIVKVQSGREESIKSAIERRVKIEGLEEHFGGIKIPMERVSELRNGKRVVRARKKFPGYLMVNVEFNDRILYLFRETSGVGDFVGGSIQRAPTPMPQHEVDRMLAEEAAAEGKQVPREKIKLKFDKGDRVKVRDGTFQGMEGEVKAIVEPKEAKDAVKVRVELTIFGRPVPVEVEAWQVDPV